MNLMHFRRFHNRRALKRYLALDDFHEKQPRRLEKPAAERAPYPARISVAVRPTGEVA
jgi:hypothetical protein